MPEALMPDLPPAESNGPIGELLRTVADFLLPHLPRDFQWPMLPISVAIALCLWLRLARSEQREGRPTLLAFLLPRDIYTHVSARVDIGLYVFERVLRPLWIAALLLLAPAVESGVIGLLGAVFGQGPALTPNLGWMLLYSLVTLLCYDFFFFWIHYAGHKVPALWAIHQVHHSAEVLTPLTRYREHVFEGPMYAAGAGLGYGVAGGLFGWLFAGGLVQATLFNMGFFAFLFGLTGFFRHYHVPFHYPRWLSLWLHSPVMHHVHHSYLPQHLDQNFAAVTSIWDRMAGTLYIPAKDEATPWGLHPSEQGECRGLIQNILAPISTWGRLLRQRLPRAARS